MSDRIPPLAPAHHPPRMARTPFMGQNGTSSVISTNPTPLRQHCNLGGLNDDRCEYEVDVQSSSMRRRLRLTPDALRSGLTNEEDTLVLGFAPGTRGVLLNFDPLRTRR